ncbi:MAG TPA: ATP-binding protein, partial [Puia sp.]|nr:ATP-binding protein [Puia sp.]
VRINKLQQEFQHAILSSKLEMQEQTFQEISQEIHDNIGQILSLAKLHIATMDAAGSPVLENKIRDSKALVSKAIGDLRNLSYRLNTDYITDVGFDNAVKREIETIRRSEAYEARFSIEGKPYRFDQQKELILFRIVQELLNNILKHARAKTITVELHYSPTALLVTIRDDGQGFDRSALGTPATNGNGSDSEGHGLGIKSMYHRARLIGAEFQLTSAIGAGTVAAIHIPFNPTIDSLPLQPAKNSTL